MTATGQPDSRRASGPRLDAAAAAALEAFEASEPNLEIWRRWPHVTAEQDAYTDRWACQSVSEQCAAFLRARGVGAVVVHADDAEHPWHDEHYWVRVRCAGGDVDVDYTARQFHDLEQPGLPEHQDLPCPLLWAACDTHPVSGTYRTVRETTADGRERR